LCLRSYYNRFLTRKFSSFTWAIVTGIGFLGAGALIKNADKIFGFTNATSIWIFSIIGLLIGIGEYKEAMVTYTIVWVVISFDVYLESKGIGNYNKKIMIKTKRIVNKSKIISLFKERKWKLLDLSIDKKEKKIIS